MYNLNLFLKKCLIVIVFNCTIAYAQGSTPVLVNASFAHHYYCLLEFFCSLPTPNNLKSWNDQFHGQFSPSPWDNIFYGTNLAFMNLGAQCYLILLLFLLLFLFDSWEKGNLNLKCLYLIVENSLMVHFDSIPHHSQYMKTKK